MDGRSRVPGAEAWLAVPADGDAFVHAALLYEDENHYLGEISGFVRAALTRGDPVLVAVPAHRAGPLREVLGPDAGQVAFADMGEVGRNPGRIISAVRTFTASHPGRRVSAVGEPAWPERSAGEWTEAARHEALSNLAFAGTPMIALCPYDTAGLPPAVIAAAKQTHPLLASSGRLSSSPAFLGPGGMPRQCLAPLPTAPPDARVLAYTADLRPVRELVGSYALVAGLSPERADDLVIVAAELAANTLAHASGGGVVRVWATGGEVICEVADQGHIADPLAGWQRPAGQQGGYGRWVVHQVCDLVETRTGPGGTITRCHLSLSG